MPHMAGYCTCGRRMHWPRHTRYGDTWECYRCGAVWTWMKDGWNPMTSTRSRPVPPAGAVPAPAAVPTLPAVPPFRQTPPQPKGCAAMLAGIAGVVIFVVAWLVRAS